MNGKHGMFWEAGVEQGVLILEELSLLDISTAAKKKKNLVGISNEPDQTGISLVWNGCQTPFLLRTDALSSTPLLILQHLLLWSTRGLCSVNISDFMGCPSVLVHAAVIPPQAVQCVWNVCILATMAECCQFVTSFADFCLFSTSFLSPSSPASSKSNKREETEALFVVRNAWWVRILVLIWFQKLLVPCIFFTEGFACILFLNATCLLLSVHGGQPGKVEPSSSPSRVW